MKAIFAILLLSASVALAQTNTLRTGTYVIFTILDTNKIEIGTLTTTGGAERWRVMHDSYITNTVAMLEFEGQPRKMLLKSEKGPFIGERRERKESVQMPPIPFTGFGVSNQNRLDERMRDMQRLNLP